MNRTTADEAVQKILDFGLELNRVTWLKIIVCYFGIIIHAQLNADP